MTHDGLIPVVLDRPLPQEPEAERAVLACLLISNDSYYRLGELATTDFLNDANRHIFDAMVYVLLEERIELDHITLGATLRARGLYDAVGGGAYIADLLTNVPWLSAVGNYAAIVRKAADLRRIIITSNALMRAALEPGADPSEIASYGLAALSRHGVSDDRTSRRFDDVFAEMCEEQGEWSRSKTSPTLQSGFDTLDEHCIFGPWLTVFGAPTKNGKSALMLALTRGLVRHGSPTVMFSLESVEKALARRHGAAETGIPHHYMRDWRLMNDPKYFDRIAACQRDLAGQPMFVNRKLRTVEEIVFEIRRLKAVHGLKAAFVDYIQIVGTKAHLRDREERLAEVSQQLAAAAVDLNVHISAMSQVRDDRDPGSRLKISDLAWCKFIGKAARAVVLFQRRAKEVHNAVYTHGALKGQGIPICLTDVQIEANNEERTNDFTAHFCEVTQRFREGECDSDCQSNRNKNASPQPAQRSLAT